MALRDATFDYCTSDNLRALCSTGLFLFRSYSSPVKDIVSSEHFVALLFSYSVPIVPLCYSCPYSGQGLRGSRARDGYSLLRYVTLLLRLHDMPLAGSSQSKQWRMRMATGFEEKLTGLESPTESMVVYIVSDY